MVCLCAVFCTRVRAKVQHTTVSGVYCCCRCKLVGTILVPAERPRVLSSTAFAAHQAGRAVSCASEVRSRTKNKHLHTCTPAARKRVYFQHLPPPLCMHDPGTCTCSCTLPSGHHRSPMGLAKAQGRGTGPVLREARVVPTRTATTACSV